MKKLISVMAVTLSLMLLLSMAAFSTSDSVTSTGTGFSNVEFSNGYRGFCIDQDLSGAYSGDNFSVADKTSVATNNSTGADVSQKLKILFTQCFESMFVSDGNGGYVMDSLKADSSVQTAVWNITDGRYIWGEAKTFIQTVDAYTGPEIPDEGYARMLDNGDVITFYFMVVEPQNNASQQSFFAYKIEVGQQTPHEHNYSDEWTSDDTNHWHECACGDKKDVAEHEGNTPDCTTPSICEECEKQLADKDKKNHTGGTVVKNDKPAQEFEDGYSGDVYCGGCDELLEKGEILPATHKHDYSDNWSSNETEHWHECACGDKKDVESHDGTIADCTTPSICEECKKELAGVDKENHTGGTVVKNDKPAQEFENGYSGDVYCGGCDELLEKGEILPATHKHDYSDRWSSNETEHWHECECGDKKDVAEHEGNTPDCTTPSICEECKKELAGVDKENHTGGTVVKNDKPAQEFEDGYSGDVYCGGCDELLEKGEILPATHKHDYSDKWSSNETEHWHECECGDKKDVAEHEGNTADCITPSICEECEKQLADKDKENHTGGTVVKNDKPAQEFEDGYSGDVYCGGCDELLEKGEILPATHKHDYSDDWKSDETEHWHECACGDKKDVAEHEGNTPDCTTPSICEECKKELAGVDKENHTGGTVIKNDKPAQEFEDGYSGDVYCGGCDELLEKGEILPATHKHDYSDDWKSNETEHWHECECGDKKDVAEHEGNTPDCTTPSICEECEKQLADKDKENHTGGTVVKNDKPAQEFEDGYSGDVYCGGCDELLEKGEILPATHKHDHSDKWTSNETEHWHECECGDKKDVAEHEGNTPDCTTPSICEECEKQLADKDKKNHTGSTVVKNDKPAQEFEDGYSGDIYCGGCDELLEKGEILPATHKHDYSDKWTSNETEHWHECACGDKKDVESHDGTTADCTTPSICEECKKELAGVDKENHTGGTVVKNDKPAQEVEDGYSGDVYCGGCDELLEKGEVLPATHKHDYSDDWKSNETEHWHECECGDKKDVAEHEGNTPDCTTPSICEECEKQLADKDKTNHAGGTVVKNAKEATSTEDGYTGDTYCLGCDTLIEIGSVIPMSHEHSYSDEWKSDDKNHWHECSCKDRKDEEAHRLVLGKCTVCGKSSSSSDIDTDAIGDALGSILDTIIGAGSGLDFGDLGFGNINFGDLGFGSGNGNGSGTGNGSNSGSDGDNGTSSDNGNGSGSGSDNNSGSNTNSGSSSTPGADSSTKPGTDNGQNSGNGNSGTNTNGSTVNKDDNTVSPDTGNGYAFGFAISVMLISTCALAVIRRKESLTA